MRDAANPMTAAITMRGGNNQTETIDSELAWPCGSSIVNEKRYTGSQGHGDSCMFR